MRKKISVSRGESLYCSEISRQAFFQGDTGRDSSSSRVLVDVGNAERLITAGLVTEPSRRAPSPSSSVFEVLLPLCLSRGKSVVATIMMMQTPQMTSKDWNIEEPGVSLRIRYPMSRHGEVHDGTREVTTGSLVLHVPVSLDAKDEKAKIEEVETSEQGDLRHDHGEAAHVVPHDHGCARNEEDYGIAMHEVDGKNRTGAFRKQVNDEARADEAKKHGGVRDDEDGDVHDDERSLEQSKGKGKDAREQNEADVSCLRDLVFLDGRFSVLLMIGISETVLVVAVLLIFASLFAAHVHRLDVCEDEGGGKGKDDCRDKRYGPLEVANDYGDRPSGNHVDAK